MNPPANPQGPPPERGGIYIGTVADNRDPEQRGRLRVRVPTVNPTEELAAWAIPFGMSYGPTVAGIIIPPVGAQVFVMFVEGRVDVPVWTPGTLDRGATPDAIRTRDPNQLAGRYPSRRAHYSDPLGVAVIEDEMGNVEVDLRARKLTVDTHNGDVDVDTLPDGKVVINRGDDTKKAARLNDTVRVFIPTGAVVVAVSGGAGVTNPEPIECDGTIVSGSDHVYIGD